MQDRHRPAIRRADRTATAQSPPGGARRAGGQSLSEVVYESDLVDRIDRARFWANFGAVAATLAAIIGVIALVVALQAKDDANNRRRQQRRPAAAR